MKKKMTPIDTTLYMMEHELPPYNLRGTVKIF